ncbi:hypothetical protein [Staphylococcus pseudoxylosus]|uniref:hypothetical protein n=1 Tax=Staphylococcus pseudoxylosus TaxID=2282419 RepID=UPI002DBAA0FC|nr:hypothetical protein [Staphylococcus pseudoxylosus]MEB6038017.1 hypothetical protein [Staphylococcus pseudoxylosus]
MNIIISIINVLEYIDNWFRPEKYKNRKKVKLVKKSKSDKKEGKEILKRGKIGIELIDMPNALDTKEVAKQLMQSNSHIGYFFHDSYCHQLAVKFEANSSKRFQVRNGSKRKQLEPLLEPEKKEVQDATHLIPVGYHGSENDRRLLVGFDRKINRKYLKNFEDEIKEINKTKEILWFVNIIKQKDNTVKWYAYIWDNKGNVIKQKMFHDKNKFKWK